MQFDEQELRKAIAILKPDNQLYEIRIMSGKKIFSGYFRGSDCLVCELDKFSDNSASVYFSLNGLNDACYSREQRDRLEQFTKATTSDNDIIKYNWLMVDLDPKRPTGTSSSAKELQKAKGIANRIYKFMNDRGFEKPIVAESGNGVHLLYKVDFEANKATTTLMEMSLKTLDMLFSTPEIEVDKKNFNPARICKMYGTMARKGKDTAERPHRMSRIIKPESVKPTEIKYFKELVNMLPVEMDKPAKYNNYSPKDFDLDSWLDKYHIGYEKVNSGDYTKYVLNECPFDSNHKGKDACLFKSSSGAIGFHCFHNSCSEHTWHDFRLHYEPDAYDKKNQEWENRAYHNYNRDPRPEVKIVQQGDKPIFYSANDIISLPKVEESFIKTGITEIDKRTRGLKKGFVTVESGLRAAAKSTVLSQIGLNAIDSGNRVGFFSGELTEKNFMRWMMQQAAGKGYVENSKYEGYYNVPITIQKKVAAWMGDKFWLYNNAYGNKYEAVIDQFVKAIDEKKLDLLILDNLMAFDIRNLSPDKFEAQSAFVLSLERIAKEKNVHIIFVAHPRKSLGFLRLNDISGSGDLANAVDNALIIHRNNNDFQRMTKEMFGWHDDDPIYQATNVIEIAKDRDGGTQDVFVPLWYEVESKRLKNSPAESIAYGWNDGFHNSDEPTPFD